MAISMTEAAAQHVRRSLEGRGKGELMKRVGMRCRSSAVEQPHLA